MFPKLVFVMRTPVKTHVCFRGFHGLKFVSAERTPVIFVAFFNTASRSLHCKHWIYRVFPLCNFCSQGRTIAFGAFSGLVLRLLCLRRLPSRHVEIVVFSVVLQTLNLLRFARVIAQRVTSKKAVL
jgi:hypothetical protein